MTDEIVAKWSDPGSDPLADIQRMIDEMYRDPGHRPNVIYMPIRYWLMIARRQMSKRAFRRYRARMRRA